MNTASGYFVVFCGKEEGHNDQHSFEIKDRHDDTVGAVNWRYLGKTGASDNYAKPLSERCTKWIHLAPLPKLTPDTYKFKHGQQLLIVVGPENEPSTGFCCGKSPEHDGTHARCGKFDPLGMKWEIVW